MPNKLSDVSLETKKIFLRRNHSKSWPEKGELDVWLELMDIRDAVKEEIKTKNAEDAPITDTITEPRY